MTSKEVLENVLKNVMTEADIEVSAVRFPVIIRKGKNDFGKTVRFYLNYSEKEQETPYIYKDGTEILTGKKAVHGENLKMEPWGVKIVEEE